MVEDKPGSSSKEFYTDKSIEHAVAQANNIQRKNSAHSDCIDFADKDKRFSHFRHSKLSLSSLRNENVENTASSNIISLNTLNSRTLTFGDKSVKIMMDSSDASNVSSPMDKTQIVSGNDDSSRGGSDSNRTLDSRPYPLFNGLINDIRSRYSQYRSDIVDAANFQCLTSLVFMFFASFAPSITFGGLMGKYTNETIGTTETLLAQCICGVIFGLFAAQPLLIMSPTGPVLIFEASLYTVRLFCDYMELDFLTIRLYTGAWIFAISVCTSAVDGSRLLKYVTRFTEDIFATLISAIFIAESIHFLWHTFQENPVEDYKYYLSIHSNCRNSNVIAAALNEARNGAALTANAQLPEVAHVISNIETLKSIPILSMQLPFDRKNETFNTRNVTELEAAAVRFAIALKHARQSVEASGNATALSEIRICSDAEPNTALLTAFIMIATFSLALLFKRLRESFYFGKHIRRVIGDFGVLIAIVLVAVAVQLLVPDPYLQRLDMPDHLSFTNGEKRGHGVLVVPMINADLGISIIVALAAALLIFILLFVETEITELLLNKHERGCRKGNGMNWDLVLVGFCALICSLFGLPWMCAAAVQSLAHCSSLTVMKRKLAGAKNEVDHVIEQRVTTIGVSLLIGAIALGGSYLRMPLASLFGVFLYLGVMNLSGVQLVERVVLFFIPEKYFPHKHYTEQMTIWRIYLYTWIQIMCLFIVYVVKYFKHTALGFPFVLALFIIFRHVVLPHIFTEKELKAIDGELEEQGDEWMKKDFYEHSRIPI